MTSLRARLTMRRMKWQLKGSGGPNCNFDGQGEIKPEIGDLSANSTSVDTTLPELSEQPCNMGKRETKILARLLQNPPPPPKRLVLDGFCLEQCFVLGGSILWGHVYCNPCGTQNVRGSVRTKALFSYSC